MVELIELIGGIADLAGVAVIVVGILLATVLFLRKRLRRDSNGLVVFKNYRHNIGRSMLLGLEILVAADIIHTIAVEPTFYSLGTLAVIVLIRTFLSATLELELEGRWPWQREAVEIRNNLTKEIVR